MSRTEFPRRARLARLAAGLAAAGALALLGACAAPPPAAQTNRPDGEGYAGVGELLVRIGLPEGTGWAGVVAPSKRERGFVEIRYQGLDSLGRAVFERHDGDALAATAPPGSLPTTAKGTALMPTPAGSAAPGASGGATPNTREIALDLRLARQIHVQGKIIEVIEATASGVVFRLY